MNRKDRGLPDASSVLAVCAHPDDESFGLGAVLQRFVADGAAVAILCFSAGEASSLGHPESPLAESPLAESPLAESPLAASPLADLRRAELSAAAAALGIHRVELLDHPDGGLAEQSLEDLAREVSAMVEEVGADLLVVFDEGGVTGHPDHHRATEAALEAAAALPVLAWSVPRDVADLLNAEFGTSFTGRDDREIDLVVRVDRRRQHQAIACHRSQSSDNPVLWRRLELLGDEEALCWLRPPG